MNVPYTYSPLSLMVVINGSPITVPNTHLGYPQALELLRKGLGTAEALAPLLDTAAAVTDFAQGRLAAVGGHLFFGEREISNLLATRILAFVRSGDTGLAAPLINFLERCMRNTSRRAVEALYEWLEHSNLPIYPDGRFLAWKIVNDDYTDCYTGKFDNSIGKRVAIERNEVDEDPDQTCSYGLHFCSATYLPHYGPSDKRVMIVAIDPADVVAFPRDHGLAKGRTCAYDVIGEVPPEEVGKFFPGGTLVYEPTLYPEDAGFDPEDNDDDGDDEDEDAGFDI